MIRPLLLAALTVLPSAALACGGLFCNNVQPVNQAAERILFAQDGDTVHMHVQLNWSGPPTDFGWLLPVPPDVQTELSSETLFSMLDTAYAPSFRLIQETYGNCTPDWATNDVAVSDMWLSADSGASNPVNVLSREQVGPYDRAILQAETVESLLAWLDANAFQSPEGAAATLQPYVAMGAAFVAIKLVPGAGSQEVVPIALTFSAQAMAVPILPTANAAEPDMGIIVHVLGNVRAVPTNFRHVEINESAIDWMSRGSNYADVVSQAVDEAGGQAFVTDYAGEVNNSLPQLAALGALNDDSGWRDFANRLNLSDTDIQRVVRASITVDENTAVDDVIQCPSCYDDAAVIVDAAALIQRLNTEVNAPREILRRLFEQNRYLTRLYTTLSPAEMTTDPIFEFNPDLPAVSNRHQATLWIECVDGRRLSDEAVIETSDGQRFFADGSNARTIQRLAGETVRGLDIKAAARIEQASVAGQLQVILDNQPELRTENDQPIGRESAAGEAGGEDSCGGCSTQSEGPTLIWLVLGGFILRRRTRKGRSA